MSFIVTADADEVDVAHPTPGQARIGSIAWSLSQINRFTGHASRPYSVAEHSLLVEEICEREFGLGVHGRLAGLMHDAHEAYAGDMHSPGKRDIGEAWHRWEAKWMRFVRNAFSLQTAFVAYAAQVHKADLMALATERRDLMPATPTPWPALVDVEPVGWVRLNAPERMTMTWREWHDLFLDRYQELDFGRNEKVEAMRQANGAAS